jgi:hypothetical protein
MSIAHEHLELAAVLPDSEGGFGSCPTVMTEEELIRFLRIPEISKATDHRNVIQNLKRVHGLPRVHLCGKAVYPTDAVRRWLQERVVYSR